MNSYLEIINNFVQLAAGAQLEVSTEDDYVKAGIKSFFAQIQGTPGDIVVILALIGVFIALWRKAYKTSVGCLILACGVVLLRIALSAMFGQL